MWPKSYRDYPIDTSLKQSSVEPGRGIIGCEMHEINGWGHEHHIFEKRRRGLIGVLLESFFSLFSKKEGGR